VQVCQMSPQTYTDMFVASVCRPRVKGRFVKEMDVDMDTALEMIDEHSQVQPPPDTGMEHASQHASDAECSGEDEDPPHSSLDGEGDTCIVESCPS
jgi:hypothetical protein